MRASEFIVEQFLVELSEKAQRQAIARFEAEQQKELTDQKRTQIQRCVELWSKHGSGDIFQLSFDQAYQIVDNNLLKQELKGRATEQLEPDDNPDAEPDYENIAPEDSDLIIYLGNSKKKCIAYGDGYEFCISRKDGSNLYDWYRYQQYKTFYFVRNPNKPTSNNTHLIVINVDRQGNFEYTLADNSEEVRVNRNWKQIVKLEPELAELEHLFVYVEPTAEELRRYRLANLAYSNLSLKEYQALSPRDKFIYIEVGRIIPPELQDATVVEGDPVLSQLLIGAYVKRNPHHFTDRSWNRLSKGDQRYVRKRIKQGYEEDPSKYFDSMLVVGLLDEFSKEELLKMITSNYDHGRAIVDLKPELLADDDTQVAVVTEFPRAIDHIIHIGIRPSKRVQIAAVSADGNVFRNIVDADLKPRIIPGEEVQLAAVKNTARAIIDILEFGIRPSEPVLIAAASSKDFGKIVLEHILAQRNILKYTIPDRFVEILFFRIPHLFHEMFKEGIRPSERAQRILVAKQPFSIRSLLRMQIAISDNVQFIAVFKQPIIIEFILKSGIRPSERVQLAAVKKRPALIISILDANSTDPIIPSEAVQIAAVSRQPEIIEALKKRRIVPSANVVAAAEKAKNSINNNDNDNNDEYKDPIWEF